MPSGSTLRYDGLSMEDFLAALNHRGAGGADGLPLPQHLKEARIESTWTPGTLGPTPLTLFLLQEQDALSGRKEVFVLLHGEGEASRQIRDLVLRLRAYLRTRGIASLLRIDPRYGLLCGSALEPLDPSVQWDRPTVYAALYLTDDPASPSLAVMEYVPVTQQEGFREAFLRYNGVEPARSGILASAFRRFTGGKPPSASPAGKLSYGMVATLAAFLAREGGKDVRLSLIFKDLSPLDARTCLLDPDRATYHPSGNDRFFASLGELA
ncbi:MAG: hypothetical protein AB1347_04905 [Acidobacteriota bacterium]